MEQSPLQKTMKGNFKPQFIQDMSKFEVFCRIRPLQGAESSTDIVINQEKPTITITEQAKNTSKEFNFHCIFSQDTTQNAVTQELSDKIFQNCRLNGKGSLVLSYGVTNSGKTFTILGTEDEPGLLPVVISRILRDFPEEKLRVTALEAYNDQFFSLDNRMKLLPKELYGTYQFEDYQPEFITIQSIKPTMLKYIKNRSHADTKANKNSSRSHAIFKIQCDEISVAIVDLAGSERLNKASTNVQETTSINTSLLVLGRCIHAFRDMNVVPYRESKLTKALAEYFNPLYKIFMVSHINRSGEMFHQNVNVLEYAAVSMIVKHLNPQMNRSILKSARQKKSCRKNLQKEKDNSVMKNGQNQSIAQGKKRKKSIDEDEDPLDKMIQQKMQKNKRKAMEIYISHMIGSMQEFDYYLDAQFQKQNKKDQEFIAQMRNARYVSPKKQETVSRELADAEDRIKIRMEILAEIQMEKKKIQVECSTDMGPSMRKCLEESMRRNPPQNVVETDDSDDEEEQRELATPAKENNKVENEETVLEKIWTHSKTVIKSTTKAIENVVYSLRDLSRKREKQEELLNRRPNLSFINQAFNEKIEYKRRESDKKRSMNQFLSLLEKIDNESVCSEKNSLLLDSINDTREEKEVQVHFNSEQKQLSGLAEIRESEEYSNKKSSSFLNENVNIQEKEESQKIKDKRSTFEESETRSETIQHCFRKKSIAQGLSFTTNSSQQASLDHEDSKRSAASKSKTKKPMMFKYQKPDFSCVKTRHQRMQTQKSKQRIG